MDPTTVSTPTSSGGRRIPVRPAPKAPTSPQGNGQQKNPLPCLSPLSSAHKAARKLLAKGFWPIAIHPKDAEIRTESGVKIAQGKEPIGKGWGLRQWTDKELDEAYRDHPEAGVGVCLGPDRGPNGEWLIDIEGDGPEAEASRATLFGGEIVETMGWGSKRGYHGLLFVDPTRLLPITAKLKAFEGGKGSQPGVYHDLPGLPDLELRIGGRKPDGTVKQVQSVCPPTNGTDDEPRVWSKHRGVAVAPDSFYETLERIAAWAPELQANPIAKEVYRPTHAADRSALEAYGTKALTEECDLVARTREPGRNEQLNRSAFRVGRLVEADAVNESEARAALIAAGLQTMLPEGEVRDTVLRAIEDGKRYPRDLSHVGLKTKSEPKQQPEGVGEPQGEPEEEIIDRWPKHSPQMFHGIAGDLVEMVKDRTEADPVALLIQFLVAFGNIVGRGPHFVVNKTCHYMVLFVAIIGATASGRKGTAFDIIRYLLRLIEDIWADRKIKSGLVSGEGLIYHVRDHKVTINKKGEEELEPGVDDKRLLVVETEMSRMLKAMNRENSTLSDVIRQSWDGHILDTMGKHNPDTATGAHVSLIGHCTRPDLAKHLTDTDSANGLGNRFLWTCSRKSKDLPDGDNLSDLDWDGIADRLRMAIDFARETGEMSRDDEAAHIWRQIYPELGEEKPGLLGSLINRGQAYVMRLACIYALLDQSPEVRKEHLGAAYAVWEYCEKSARFVFGDSHGDPETEKLLKALREAPNGLTQTEITANVFQKNTGRKAIAKLLGTMLTNGMIHCVKEASTGGRPPVRWFAGRGNAPTN